MDMPEETTMDAWGEWAPAKKGKKGKKGILEKVKAVADEKKTKLSTYLTSPLVAVKVIKSHGSMEEGAENSTLEFNLHSQLLIEESEYFKKHLEGKFQDSDKYKAELEDIDPAIFGFFVEYLYRDGLILGTSVLENDDYVNLAMLYSLGERLCAEKFQNAVYKKLTDFLISSVCPPNYLFQILEIVSNELPERTPEIGLRYFMFAYTYKRVGELWGTNEFVNLLKDVPDLGRYILSSGSYDAICSDLASSSNSTNKELLPGRFARENRQTNAREWAVRDKGGLLFPW